MENDDLRYLAEDIASDILTVAYTSDDDVECTRAQMMLVQSDGTERNMGGRCKESIVRVVLSRLLNSPSSQSGHNRTKADT